MSATETKRITLANLAAHLAGSNLTANASGVISASGGGGTTVVANPSGAATVDLEKLQVGNTTYGIPTPEGGAVTYTNIWSRAFSNTTAVLVQFDEVIIRSRVYSLVITETGQQRSRGVEAVHWQRTCGPHDYRHFSDHGYECMDVPYKRAGDDPVNQAVSFFRLWKQSGSSDDFYALITRSDIVTVTLYKTNIGATAATSLLGLNDTPGSYSGDGGKFLAVNAGTTGIEFIDLPAGNFSGITTSSQFSGNGLATDPLELVEIRANQVTSGMFIASRIPDLAAAKITSGTFSVGRIPNLGAGHITSGTFTVGRIPDLSADKITSATLAVARIPLLSASQITNGTFAVGRIPNLGAGQITSGTFGTQRIQNNAITAAKIADETITGDQIAAGAIHADNIESGTIGFAKMFADNMISANGIWGTEGQGNGQSSHWFTPAEFRTHISAGTIGNDTSGSGNTINDVWSGTQAEYDAIGSPRLRHAVLRGGVAMPLYRGSTEQSALHRGGSDIAKVYRGATEVWAAGGGTLYALDTTRQLPAGLRPRRRS